ncbi:hypothetical protein J7K05_00775 [bacterium]|nr:hypothetical protein [bacterium]
MCSLWKKTLRNYPATLWFATLLVLLILALGWARWVKTGYIFSLQNILSGIIPALIPGLSVEVAFYLYEKKTFEEKMQAINLLKKQLEILGSWTKYEEGGYHRYDMARTADSKLREWGNPFYNIFNPDVHTVLGQTLLLPGTAKLGPKINEYLARLNQEIRSFNNTLEEIRRFKFSSDAYKNIVLHLKLNVPEHVEARQWLKKLKKPQELKPKEKIFAKKLTEMYAHLHFYHISDELDKRLFYWHKKTYEAVLKKEKWLLGQEAREDC